MLAVSVVVELALGGQDGMTTSAYDDDDGRGMTTEYSTFELASSKLTVASKYWGQQSCRGVNDNE